MRNVLIVLLLPVLFAFQCNKDSSERCLTDLSITATTPPATGTVGADLRIPLTCSGPDLCYSFASLEILNPQPRRYEVRVKGTRPCGPAMCPQAIYSADTAVHIVPPVAGQYIITYLMHDAISSYDTIQVN